MDVKHIQERLRPLREVQMPAHVRDRVRDAIVRAEVSSRPAIRAGTRKPVWMGGSIGAVAVLMIATGVYLWNSATGHLPGPSGKQTDNMMHAESPAQGLGSSNRTGQKGAGASSQPPLPVGTPANADATSLSGNPSPGSAGNLPANDMGTGNIMIPHAVAWGNRTYVLTSENVSHVGAEIGRYEHFALYAIPGVPETSAIAVHINRNMYLKATAESHRGDTP
ncbi:hypothetical protein GCM10025857_05850 [Alicyclobacillus contaminans]|nr:hypothetical protein GCM10025857_05850 [Alicyclobacillus contaminans]